MLHINMWPYCKYSHVEWRCVSIQH